VKFNALLTTHGFTQHVQSSTHVGGHLLDVFLVRQLTTRRVDVSPPGGLSDHSMIVGHINVMLPAQYDTVTRRTRCWRSFDVHAFLRDVSDSPFVRTPPTDVNELFTGYFNTFSSPLSCHPISQLSFVSKLVERAVAVRFVNHCDQNGQLPVRQSAYRRHHSTETAVLIVYNDIICAVDKGQVVPLVLLDLSSAFDTVGQNCLLSVLQHRFSVDCDAMTWFRSYLADRTRTFVAGKDHHGPLPVNCSVPQGSVLGPIKFISYTEDVAELIAQHGVSYHLFADDMQLYTAVLSDEIHVARQRLTFCIGVGVCLVGYS